MRSLTPLLLCACTAGKPADAVRPTAPTVAQADPTLASSGGQNVTACTKPARADLMAVDWTPEMRGDFEVAMKEGLAVVRYDCRSIELVHGCGLPGSYGYIGMTRRDKKIEMNNKDEVAANLPMGGIAWLSDVSAKLGRESALAAHYVMVGKRSAARKRAGQDELDGSCDGATHFVRAATVGAFAVATGSKAEIGGSAKILGRGASAGSSSATTIQAQDGDVAACEKSTPDGGSPPDQCGAVLRVELEPLGERLDGAAAELGIAACPPGFAESAGACRRREAAGPYQCTPGNATECEDQCTGGHAGSCAILAVMLRDGTGVTKDWERAATLAQQACDEDQLAACRLVAVAKLGGQGVKKDKPGAIALLDKTCTGGDGMACVELGAARLSDKKLAQDAVYAFRRACYGGEHDGCAWLGTLYADGKGGQSANPKIAVKFFEKGCKEGSTRACVGLADLLKAGKGIDKDVARAKELFAKACNAGDAKACKKK
jgi:uncharacterized protein